MIFGIILLAIAAILLVWFVAWFIITRVNGNCPLCAMEKIATRSVGVRFTRLQSTG